jgi:hypothetical protein
MAEEQELTAEAIRHRKNRENAKAMDATPNII